MSTVEQRDACLSLDTRHKSSLSLSLSSSLWLPKCAFRRTLLLYGGLPSPPGSCSSKRTTTTRRRGARPDKTPTLLTAASCVSNRLSPLLQLTPSHTHTHTFTHPRKLTPPAHTHTHTLGTHTWSPGHSPPSQDVVFEKKPALNLPMEARRTWQGRDGSDSCGPGPETVAHRGRPC